MARQETMEENISADDLMSLKNGGCVESAPTWGAVIYTVSPLLLKAAFSKAARVGVKRLVGNIRSKSEKAKLENKILKHQAILLKNIRKEFVDTNNLKLISQNDFDALEIRDGRRVCPPGFDYSDVAPGEKPCLFINQKSTTGYVPSFLGHFKQWPDDSSFGNGCVFGLHSSSGQRSKLYGCVMHDCFTLQEKSIVCDSKANSGLIVKSGVVGLGFFEVGNNCQIEKNVIFKESITSNNGMGGYTIGYGLKAAANFHMLGKQNKIGRGANLEHGFLLQNVVVGDNFTCTGGEIFSCIINGSNENPYKLIDTKVWGSEAEQSCFTGKGKIESCKINSNVLISDGVILKDTQVSVRNVLSDRCSFTSCHIVGSSNDSRAVGVGNKFKDCVIDNLVIKDSLITDTAVKNTTIIDSKQKGDAGSVEHCLLSGSNEIRGLINLEPSTEVTGQLRVYSNNISSDNMPRFSEQSKLTMNSCVLSGDESKTFILHDGDNRGCNKITLNKCQFLNVENLQANIQNVKLNKTEVPNVSWPKGLEILNRHTAPAQANSRSIPPEPSVDEKNAIVSSYESSVDEFDQRHEQNERVDVQFQSYESSLVPALDESTNQVVRKRTMGPRS